MNLIDGDKLKAWLEARRQDSFNQRHQANRDGDREAVEFFDGRITAFDSVAENLDNETLKP